LDRTSADVEGPRNETVELILRERHINHGNDALFKPFQVVTQKLIRYSLGDFLSFINIRASVARSDRENVRAAVVGLKPRPLKLFDEGLTEFTSFRGVALLCWSGVRATPIYFFAGSQMSTYQPVPGPSTSQRGFQFLKL
jgi:hypothetical protein